MRATISFEADVSRVNDIMRSLVLEESNALQDALMSLEKATADRIVEGISEALEHIHGVTNQLEQYRQMMVSFERARFETILPQPAPSPQLSGDIAQGPTAANEEGLTPNVLESLNKLKEAVGSVNNLNRFENFIDKINSPADGTEDSDDPEEG